jgi:uncharacterized protein (DUF58 family)
MQIIRILLFCGIAFYLLPGLIMLIFSIALFFSFLYFVTRLSTVLSSTNKGTRPSSNNSYQEAQGVTIECEEYRIKKS